MRQAIPRVIWALWLQGWDGAPEIVRACARTWEGLNPHWSFRPLDRTSLPGLLDEALLASLDARGLPPEAFANVVRMELLARFGGVWADATTYCLRPLDDWLGDAAAGGFFAFAKPGPDRMLSNWFLAAAPGDPIVRGWAARTLEYWENRSEPHTYFWHHGLFAECYASDPAFRAAWDAVPEMLADGPHHYAPYHDEFRAPVSERDRDLVERPVTPLLKLTHKLPPGAYPVGSTFRYLCDRAFALPPPLTPPAARRPAPR